MQAIPPLADRVAALQTAVQEARKAVKEEDMAASNALLDRKDGCDKQLKGLVERLSAVEDWFQKAQNAGAKHGGSESPDGTMIGTLGSTYAGAVGEDREDDNTDDDRESTVGLESRKSVGEAGEESLDEASALEKSIVPIRSPLKLDLHVDPKASHVRGPADIVQAARLAKSVSMAQQSVATAKALRTTLEGDDDDDDHDHDDSGPDSKPKYADDGRLIPDGRLLRRYEGAISKAGGSVAEAERVVESHDEGLKRSAAKRLLRLLAKASKRLRESQNAMEMLWAKQKFAVKLSNNIRRKRRRSSLSASPVAIRNAVSGLSADAMQLASSGVLAATKARSYAMGMPEVSAALELAGFFDGSRDPGDVIPSPAGGSMAASMHSRGKRSEGDPGSVVFSPAGAEGRAGAVRALHALGVELGEAEAKSPTGSSMSSDDSPGPVRRRTRRGKRISMILKEPEEAADAEQALLDAASGQPESGGGLTGFIAGGSTDEQAGVAQGGESGIQALPAFTPAAAAAIREFAEKLLPKAEDALRRAAKATIADEQRAKEALNQQRLLDVAEASAALSRSQVRLRTVAARLEALKSSRNKRKGLEDPEMEGVGIMDASEKLRAGAAVIADQRRVNHATELVSEADSTVDESKTLRDMVGVNSNSTLGTTNREDIRIKSTFFQQNEKTGPTTPTSKEAAEGGSSPTGAGGLMSPSLSLAAGTSFVPRADAPPHLQRKFVDSVPVA